MHLRNTGKDCKKLSSRLAQLDPKVQGLAIRLLLEVKDKILYSKECPGPRGREHQSHRKGVFEKEEHESNTPKGFATVA